MVLDARGKACPQPVVMALRALETRGEETLDVLVDNDAAVQNLQRMAAQKGCPSAVLPGEGMWTVRIGQPDGSIAENIPEAAPCPTCAPENAVVAISSDTMGRGSEELGKLLMKSYLYALAQLDNPPRTLLFFNGGAKLTTEGSESLDDLRALEEQGAEILTCGTCLDYYGIKDKLAIGSVTNMYRIAELLRTADRLIQL